MGWLGKPTLMESRIPATTWTWQATCALMRAPSPTSAEEREDWKPTREGKLPQMEAAAVLGSGVAESWELPRWLFWGWDVSAGQAGLGGPG